MSATDPFHTAAASIEDSFDLLIASHRRLRESNASLLAAAKLVVATQDDASRRDGDARHAIRHLQSAIAKAEEPAP